MTEIELKIKNTLQSQKTHTLVERKIVILYGCTIYARYILACLEKMRIEVKAIIDNDKAKQGTLFWGINVYNPYDFLVPHKSNIVVIVCSVHAREMIKSLHEMGYSAQEILCVDIEEIVMSGDSIDFAQKKMEYVRKGYDIYKNLITTYGRETLIVIAPRASGDVYMACAFFCGWMKRSKYRDCVFVVEKENLAEIVSLYVKNPIEIISTHERTLLIHFYMLCTEGINIKFMAPWELRIWNSFFSNSNNQILFKDKFLYESFDNRTDEETKFWPYNRNIEITKGEDKRCDKKRIIISPYAYSSPAPDIPMRVWKEIAYQLRIRNYEVYTVAYGNLEEVIPYTRRLNFVYKDSLNVLNNCDGFLSVRSGICDIAHSATCKKLVIYTNRKFRYASEFFSLKNNFRHFDGKEVL